MKYHTAMRNFFTYIMAAMAITAISACSHKAEDPTAKAESLLAQAEQCVQEGDTAQAYSYALTLTDSSEYEMLPSQLCRQALLLYRISKEGEDVERLVASLMCYERAIEADPDSVDAFLNTLGTDDRADLLFVQDLNMRLNHPQDYSKYEEGDSISVEP